MEYNRYRDSSGKIHKSCESDNISINFNNNRQKDGGLSHQHNNIESPYTINKNTQTADFSVVTTEQSKFIKPVDTANLNMNREGDPNLTTHSTELLRTNEPDQQKNTFWFPTPKNPGKT